MKNTIKLLTLASLFLVFACAKQQPESQAPASYEASYEGYVPFAPVSGTYNEDGVYETTVTARWEGTYDIDRMYRVRVVTNQPVPCDVYYCHIGGPSYDGFDGILVPKGATQSKEFVYDGYLPGLGGPSPSVWKDEDGKAIYYFHGTEQSQIRYYYNK